MTLESSGIRIMGSKALEVQGKMSTAENSKVFSDQATWFDSLYSVGFHSCSGLSRVSIFCEEDPTALGGYKPIIVFDNTANCDPSLCNQRGSGINWFDHKGEIGCGRAVTQIRVFSDWEEYPEVRSKKQSFNGLEEEGA